MEEIEKEYERLEAEIDELLSLLNQKNGLDKEVEHLMGSSSTTECRGSRTNGVVLDQTNLRRR